MSSSRTASSLPFFLILLFSACLAHPVTAQVTVDTNFVGAIDTQGCQNTDNPPTLTGHAPATGEVEYSFDAATNILTLTVSNTTPVVTGVANPLITHIYVNLPHLAVSNVALLSQTGAGGATPNFNFSFDTDSFDAIDSVIAGCFGKFGIRLSRGALIDGGIANPAADTLPGTPGAAVIGPAVFQFQITTPSPVTLTVTAFSNALAVEPLPLIAPCNTVLKFRAAGPGEENGLIGNKPRCAPGGWVIGTPSIGNTVTFVMSGAAGCEGCLIVSLNPGPTIIDGTPYQIGLPFYPIISEAIVPNTVYTVDVMIPNAPGIVGITVYGLVGLVDPLFNIVQVSDTFSSTILP